MRAASVVGENSKRSGQVEEQVEEDGTGMQVRAGCQIESRFHCKAGGHNAGVFLSSMVMNEEVTPG